MTPTRDRPVEPLDAELHVLHDDYVRSVNAALESGREDVARELAELYPDDALRGLAGALPR